MVSARSLLGLASLPRMPAARGSATLARTPPSRAVATAPVVRPARLSASWPSPRPDLPTPAAVAGLAPPPASWHVPLTSGNVPLLNTIRRHVLPLDGAWKVSELLQRSSDFLAV